MLLQRSPVLKVWARHARPATSHIPCNGAQRAYAAEQDKDTSTDIDVEALKRQDRRIFGKSLEKLPENISGVFSQRTEFIPCEGRTKAMRRFQAHQPPEGSVPRNCDLIVCRNVLIYFTEEAKSQMYAKFNKALKDRGVLFIGSTEQIIMSARYKLTPIKTFFISRTAISDMHHGR